MKQTIQHFILLPCMILIFAGCSNTQTNQESNEKDSSVTEGIRMTVLDGGVMDLNLDYFSTDSSYTGQRKIINNPVFIIEHPKGRLIWDTGLPDVFADMTEEQLAALSPIGISKLDKKLINQLADMELTPDSIDYVVFSHSHADHAGNGNYFVNSTWLVRQAEYDFAFSEHGEQAMPFYKALKDSPRKIIEGKYDVFGDGKVVIHPYPGHTPGHSCLYLDFDNHQDLILTGDLYHFQAQRRFFRMPIFNSDYKQTLASMKAFEEDIKSMDAQVVIQHDAEHFKKLPKYPDYWN